MAKTYQYCVAENWGKGFINHDESFRITFRGYPANVWQVPAYNKHALVDAEVQAAQAAWDALPDAEKAPAVETNPRPADIILEE